MSGSKYLRWCLGLTFLLVSVVGLINYYADPCGIYHYGKSWDWIHSRPEAFNASFIFKADAVEHANADVLFMGSSRTAEGLDPHNPDVPGHAFNLGLPDSNAYQQWRYLQHASAAHLPTTVVYGVEMDSFSAHRRMNPLYTEDRLLVRPDGSRTPELTDAFADLAPTLFSLSTLKLSASTLEAQKNSRLIFDEGYEANAPIVIDHLDLASEVYAANRKYLGPREGYRAADGTMPQMDAFDHILTLCAAKHIHLIVFIQPTHSALLDYFTQDWAVYSGWERELVSRMEAHPALHEEFWDFAGYNSMSTEPFPAPGETYNHMHYYWEGSHYRKVVGDMVLERIFKGTGPAAFGQLVTSATVDQDLQRLATEKKAWHDLHQSVNIEPTQAPVRIPLLSKLHVPHRQQGSPK